MNEVPLRERLVDKLGDAIRAQGYGDTEQQRDQAIEVAALAFALHCLPEDDAK